MFKGANNATSTLAAGILSTDLSLSVQTADAGLFPSLSAGDWHPATLTDAAGHLEIVKVTARSTAVLTIVRAQEGTTARAWNAGDRVSLRHTWAAIQDPPIPLYVDTDGTLAANSDVKVPSQKAVKTFALPASYLDTDGTLAANSDVKVPSQKAAKAYVDGLFQGVKWKQAVRVATTANGTLATAFANGQTVDGVVLATGDRILLKNQTTGGENGIYTVNASGAPTRATDCDTGTEIKDATVMIAEGTANADSIWKNATDGAITLGTTATVWVNVGANFIPMSYLDTDGTLAANSDVKVPSQKAVKTFTTGVQELFIPAGAFIPQITNGPSAGIVELATNKQPLATLDFDQTTSELAVCAWIPPKRWDGGTITFIPHWTAASGVAATTVVWGLQAVAVSDADSLDAAYGTAQTSSDAYAAANQDHIGPASAAITVAGSPADADLVWLRIYRDISDTLAADAKFLGMVLRWTSNAGSDA